MRSLLLVAILPALTFAEDRPFVRITNPADAAEVTANAELGIRGLFHQKDIKDASKFKVRARLYQGTVNKLALVGEATASITTAEGQKDVYSFRMVLRMPVAGADCVLQAEVFEEVAEGMKWVARDFAIIHPRRSMKPSTSLEKNADAERMRDPWVLVGTHVDIPHYLQGATIATTGTLTLNQTKLSPEHRARFRLYRIRAGGLDVYQEVTVSLKDSNRPDVWYVISELRPNELQPPGHYVLRIDIVDPKRPDASLQRDATILEIVPRKPVKKPQAA